MADIEETPPSEQQRPAPAPTRVLPVQPVPATLPDPADLRPVGPARRWTWLIAGLAAGAGAAALALSLVANLADPAPAPPTTAVTVTGGPTTEPYTTLVDGCALLRPETVELYLKGATCTAPKHGADGTTSFGSWTSKDSGYADAQVEVMLSPFAESIYQESLTSHRTPASTTDAKIIVDRAVPGLGDKATLFYTSYSGYGRVTLWAVRNNALISVEYAAITSSGPTPEDVPRDVAEAAAIACAKDALGTLTTP
ncbi:hypothetical protein M8Z33_27240 [Streptomyces sp. ZAF1911]|uniref:hypothetical protein n=1 Tax=Streptomyces sp. ZAF1911 TaxID=2944129 RepID=UPI00237C0B4A|nr:hypothetical protein [Streptomyces sp. ZAF1911]MDD9380283.1 hypothetical protein [Streptomyces sp. ZAF1911]